MPLYDVDVTSHGGKRGDTIRVAAENPVTAGAIAAENWVADTEIVEVREVVPL
jgi:hypothetical protein